MMSKLKIKVSKESLTLVLEIQFPLATLRKITEFIEQRKIILESMLMLNDGNRVSILVLHLLMDKDVVYGNMEALATMAGVMRLDEGDQTFDKSILRVLSPHLKKS